MRELFAIWATRLQNPGSVTASSGYPNARATVPTAITRSSTPAIVALACAPGVVGLALLMVAVPSLRQRTLGRWYRGLPAAPPASSYYARGLWGRTPLHAGIEVSVSKSS
jgi:hypothetical protein